MFSQSLIKINKYFNFNFSMWKESRFNGLIYYQISGTYNLEKWMTLIGMNNVVHYSKYLVWKKSGYHVPKSSLKERLESLNLNMGTKYR